jgi:hypothetical protein
MIPECGTAGRRGDGCVLHPGIVHYHGYVAETQGRDALKG